MSDASDAAYPPHRSVAVPAPTPRDPARIGPGLALLLVVPVLLAYALLFNLYRPWNIDNAWIASFAHNLCVHNETGDLVFGADLSIGMEGTVLFGRQLAWLHCAAFATLGWTPSVGYLVSILLLLATLGLLYPFLRGAIGLSPPQAVGFLALFALAEPAVAMANQARHESLVLLYCAAALLLHHRGRILLAALIATLAVEVHPLGITAWIYLAAAELHRVQQEGTRGLGRWLLRAAAGGLLGTAAFVALHPDFAEHLPRLFGPERPNSDVQHGHFLFPYFFEAKYLRHLPELAAALAALIWWLLRRSPAATFAVAASLGTLALGFALDRANYNYVIFWFFPTALLAMQALWTRLGAVPIAAAAALYFLPQYAVAAWINRDYRDQSYLDEIGRLVEATVPPEMPIYGHFNAWYPLRERNFQWIGRLRAAPLDRELAILCIVFHDGTVDPYNTCAVARQRVGGRLTPLGTVTSGEASLQLYRRAPGPPG
jgi:hypothetical protein